MKTQYKNWKEGDEFIVLGNPNRRSSGLNMTCPVDKPIYPYFGKIKEIKTIINSVAVNCGNYGWSFDCLIDDEIIVTP